jgi:type I restriction enzyme S subunit
MNTPTQHTTNYKNSTLGLIPEDWEVKTLRDICIKIQDGNYGGDYPKAEEFLEFGVPFLTSKAIGGLGELKEDKVDFISVEKHNKLKKAQLNFNDILFTNRGANVGTIGIVDERIANGNIGPQLTLLRCNHNEIYHDYLKNAMKSFVVQNQVKSQDSGSAMNFFGIGDTSKFKLPIPPLPEQTAIANCLSTWDKAIATQTQLIVQKELRKKALANRLLTGNVRLKGFEKEKWIEKKADAIFRNNTDKTHNGELEILSASQERGIVLRSSNNIDIKYDENSLGSYKKVEVGDYVISLRSFQGGIEYSEYEGIVSPAYTILKEIIPVSKIFYKVYFKTETFINRLNTIIYGIRDGKQISFKDFATLKLPYPSIEEQTAISNILQCADEEIQLLKKKLQQLKDQKKGLMQVLLTGNKRLNY